MDTIISVQQRKKHSLLSKHQYNLEWMHVDNGLLQTLFLIQILSKNCNLDFQYCETIGCEK